MHVHNIIKNGKVVGFRLFVCVFDKKKAQHRNKTKTYYYPSDVVSVKQQKAFLNKCQVEWQEEVENIENGMNCVIPKSTKFCDYAKTWTENLLKDNSEGISHYQRCKEQLKIFEDWFGEITLEDMKQPLIQKFAYWLQDREYIKETIVVKKDIRPYIEQQKISLRKVARESGISHATLLVALEVGQKVCRKTAECICKSLNLNIEEFFEITSEKKKYSKSANRGMRVMLNSVLQSAVRQGIIQINYASRDYISPIKGTTGTKQIYEDEEIKVFFEKVSKEQDLRKKVAFSLMIELGLRGCEIAGLEWKDINFEARELSINRNSIYINGFGIITKPPKTKNSQRTIAISEYLTQLLKEYFEFWTTQKEQHGDLWQHTDRLYVQNNGNNMSDMTIRGWLKKFQEENDLKRVTVHGLRHTNITFCNSQGIDVKTVSARAGHSDIQTTLNIYSHCSKQADRETSQMFDNYFNYKEKSKDEAI